MIGRPPLRPLRRRQPFHRQRSRASKEEAALSPHRRFSQRRRQVEPAPRSRSTTALTAWTTPITATVIVTRIIIVIVIVIVVVVTAASPSLRAVAPHRCAARPRWCKACRDRRSYRSRSPENDRRSERRRCPLRRSQVILQRIEAERAAQTATKCLRHQLHRHRLRPSQRRRRRRRRRRKPASERRARRPARSQR